MRDKDTQHLNTLYKLVCESPDDMFPPPHFVGGEEEYIPWDSSIATPFIGIMLPGNVEALLAAPHSGSAHWEIIRDIKFAIDKFAQEQKEDPSISLLSTIEQKISSRTGRNELVLITNQEDELAKVISENPDDAGYAFQRVFNTHTSTNIQGRIFGPFKNGGCVMSFWDVNDGRPISYTDIKRYKPFYDILLNKLGVKQETSEVEKRWYADTAYHADNRESVWVPYNEYFTNLSSDKISKKDIAQKSMARQMHVQAGMKRAIDQDSSGVGSDKQGAVSSRAGFRSPAEYKAFVRPYAERRYTDDGVILESAYKHMGQGLKLEYAITIDEQVKGLSNRDSLDPDSGMLFIYEKPKQLSFWMKDTTIPLDIAFIDEQGIISEIRQLDPLDERPILSNMPCLYALEVNRGWFAEKGIDIGHKIISN